ncbi:phosphatidate cytidylyltransferase [Cohaesibacter celericrescens]|uniref:Phosphatidate cytidylyltransferase n=1 Tax=Cohaesibacter celericrescens TaxID=2067669 RepID=A0A2N5XSR7_9HYPH|nr:phosphatidate cytidylyltransferase [Cohaesibacter celericrescens]PLW77495.1 phosphatidate cytidylyltransferase [Cohaesibacter celericrescens]
MEILGGTGPSLLTGDIVLTDDNKSVSDTNEKSKNNTLWSDLALRAVSGVVLAIAASAVTWWGGVAFAVFFGIVTLLIFKEWVAIVGEQPYGIPALLGFGALLTSLIGLLIGAWQAALVVPFFGAGFLFLVRCSYPSARWCGFGVLYAASFGLAILILRSDPVYGFAAIVILFALVWGTDIAAYFTGKSLGGPKLWPRVSPKKTWSGSVGGLVLGTGLALLVAKVLGIDPTVKLTLMLGGLSILSQAGDLAESHMKRLFNVKDSSNLIPGHGGVMDRVDGLLVAVVFAALFGSIFGDIGSVATGFLIW